ncbi:hypothetical protein COLO4_09566 [Corchorus olitorius]|uniref:Uncharacterized protein n=1 Tax=Corchorus olitorius TaxID=93759 RepID=A0A1R3KBR1_9ROSI|nr:hypothetical protein COLO4_09566 [Corchorus olitorius]
MDMDPRLLDAARCGNQIKIIELEDSESNIIYGTTPQGNTALHVAARFGYYFMVSDIIRRHPSLVLKTNLKGETSIHLAARAGHEDVVSAFIITVGDSIQISRITDNHGNTPLHAAVKNKHYSIVKAIAEKDQDSLVLLNDDGESVLSIAIDLISTDLAAKIINLNTSTLEYRGHDGQTPLHRAVIRQDIGN